MHRRSAFISGQSLVEVVVAVGVMVMILVVLVSGSIRALRTVRVSRSQTNAVKYAQQGLEAVRSIRDSDVSAIVNNGTAYLVNTSGIWSLTDTPQSLENGQFIRTVVIADGPSINSKLITITVVWYEGSVTKNTTMSTILATSL